MLQKGQNMDKMITVLIAVGILIGVTDTLRGNKWKLGGEVPAGLPPHWLHHDFHGRHYDHGTGYRTGVKAGGSASVHQAPHGSFHFEHFAEL